VVCVESRRIRENSEAFPGIAPNSGESGYGITPNSHESGYGIAPNSGESGYKETSHSVPSEVYSRNIDRLDESTPGNLVVFGVPWIVSEVNV
jgi:hypothetical protein